MTVEFAAWVDIGVRETNDDRVLIDGEILDRRAHSGALSLPAAAVVCDGCGGYAGGGIAAETVLARLAAETAEQLADESRLAECLAECERLVCEKQAELPNFSEMCTTVAGCVFGAASIVLFHSGDSRIYRCDRWGLAHMTVDHSAVQSLVDIGQLTEVEARRHPGRNIITRCLGIGAPPPEIYATRAPIGRGETYLLCSDGLWEAVEDEEIAEILQSGDSLPAMAERLVKRAKENRSDDNISVCLVAARGGEKAAPISD